MASPSLDPKASIFTPLKADVKEFIPGVLNAAAAEFTPVMEPKLIECYPDAKEFTPNSSSSPEAIKSATADTSGSPLVKEFAPNINAAEFTPGVTDFTLNGSDFDINFVDLSTATELKPGATEFVASSPILNANAVEWSPDNTLGFSGKNLQLNPNATVFNPNASSFDMNYSGQYVAGNGYGSQDVVYDTDGTAYIPDRNFYAGVFNGGQNHSGFNAGQNYGGVNGIYGINAGGMCNTNGSFAGGSFSGANTNGCFNGDNGSCNGNATGGLVLKALNSEKKNYARLNAVDAHRPETAEQEEECTPGGSTKSDPEIRAINEQIRVKQDEAFVFADNVKVLSEASKQLHLTHFWKTCSVMDDILKKHASQIFGEDFLSNGGDFRFYDFGAAPGGFCYKLLTHLQASELDQMLGKGTKRSNVSGYGISLPPEQGGYTMLLKNCNRLKVLLQDIFTVKYSSDLANLQNDSSSEKKTVQLINCDMQDLTMQRNQMRGNKRGKRREGAKQSLPIWALTLKQFVLGLGVLEENGSLIFRFGWRGYDEELTWYQDCAMILFYFLLDHFKDVIPFKSEFHNNADTTFYAVCTGFNREKFTSQECKNPLLTNQKCFELLERLLENRRKASSEKQKKADEVVRESDEKQLTEDAKDTDTQEEKLGKTTSLNVRGSEVRPTIVDRTTIATVEESVGSLTTVPTGMSSTPHSAPLTTVNSQENSVLTPAKAIEEIVSEEETTEEVSEEETTEEVSEEETPEEVSEEKPKKEKKKEHVSGEQDKAVEKTEKESKNEQSKEDEEARDLERYCEAFKAEKLSKYRVLLALPDLVRFALESEDELLELLGMCLVNGEASKKLKEKSPFFAEEGKKRRLREEARNEEAKNEDEKPAPVPGKVETPSSKDKLDKSPKGKGTVAPPKDKKGMGKGKEPATSATSAESQKVATNPNSTKPASLEASSLPATEDPINAQIGRIHDLLSYVDKIREINSGGRRVRARHEECTLKIDPVMKGFAHEGWIRDQVSLIGKISCFFTEQHVIGMGIIVYIVFESRLHLDRVKEHVESTQMLGPWAKCEVIPNFSQNERRKKLARHVKSKGQKKKKGKGKKGKGKKGDVEESD